jgi:asparagine synthase (glutamine-hydrolysing)
MCGISAIYKRKGGMVAVEDIARMVSAIAHRGPDDAGYARLGRGAVGLGHVRLSIIDLVSGDQPIWNEDRTIALVYNGEIYDHESMRADLEARGHRFRTRTDSEVIVHLYEEYGLDLFRHLNGEFAFVLWDERKRRLLAARDRHGVKPLFYTTTPDEVLFCSEVKGIFALGRVPRAISREYLTGPAYGAFPRSYSAFEGISSLAPGHYLLVEDEGDLRERPYWTMPYDVDETISFEDAKAGVRSRFMTAVRRRMVADVPVGTYLSGGVDSTLVCGVMSELAGAKVRAFNVGFRNSIYDESTLAERIARHFGVGFDTLDCTMDLIAREYEKTVYHVELALPNPSAVGKQMLSRLVRASGYKVCITGEGADELFGGYPYFKQEALWRRVLAGDAQAEALVPKFEQIEHRSEGLLWERSAKFRRENHPLGYPSFFQMRAEKSSPLVKLGLRGDALGFEPAHDPREIFLRSVDVSALRAMHPFNATRATALHQLNGYILPALGDRVEMANSVECRVPFLDRDLVEFTAKIPPEYFLDIPNLREKHLLREAFADVLPRFMQEEHKHPFLSPNWTRFAATTEGAAILDEYLSPERVRRTGIYRPAFVRNARRIWRLIPQRSAISKLAEVAIGTILGVHVLHHLFVERGVSSNPRYAMRDRGVPSATDGALVTLDERVA